MTPSQKIAAEALRRAERGIGPSEPGCCQYWARLVLMAALKIARPSWCLDTAWHSALAVEAHPPKGVKVFRTSAAGDTQLGDLLYAEPGGVHGSAGHVMIRVLGNRAAENSVVHDGPNGAIGFRPLEEVDFALVVRFL